MFDSALSRAQPEIIISEIKNWQNLNSRPSISEGSHEEHDNNDHEEKRRNTIQKTYTVSSRRSWCSFEWSNAGLFGKISYLSQESVEHSSVSQLRVQPPTWLAAKAWDLQVCRALAGWNIQMRTWITRPWGTDIFRWTRAGLTDRVVEAIVNKEASLYDRDPAGNSLAMVRQAFHL